LGEWLEQSERDALGAIMLDMYPDGRLEDQSYRAGQNPIEVLKWFDAGNYSIQIQPRLTNMWIQGGPRLRRFFDKDPQKAPTLNKIPFVKWNRRFVYNTSTHSLLPRRLNRTYATDGGELTSGAILHTKFLPTIAKRSAEEKNRKEHFENSALYDDYYDELTQNPILKSETSTPFTGWRQLEAKGLISRGGWV